MMDAEVHGFALDLEQCGRRLEAAEVTFLRGVLTHAASVRSEDAQEYARLVSSVHSCLATHLRIRDGSRARA
jgi:hypothetical protein